MGPSSFVMGPSSFAAYRQPTLLGNDQGRATNDAFHCVKITGPFLVTATHCSKCALELPSTVTAVHLSSKTFASGPPELTMGSIASTRPSRSRVFPPFDRRFGTCGSSLTL